MQIEWQPNDWIIIALRQRQLFGRKLCPLSLSNGLAVFDGVWIARGDRHECTNRGDASTHDPAQARRGVGHAFWTRCVHLQHGLRVGQKLLHRGEWVHLGVAESLQVG